MGQAYAAVLQAQGVPFRVIGRSRASAEAFHKATGLSVHEGGLDAALASLPAPEQAILAVGVEQLANTTQKLLSAGCKYLLLEKPGALIFSELQVLHASAQAMGAQVWMLITAVFMPPCRSCAAGAADGITSAVFEFTEWSHQIWISKLQV